MICALSTKHPELDWFIIVPLTTKEKRGIWLLPVRDSRPSTAYGSERTE